MFKKAIHFVKYNNATVLIVLAVFLLSGGVFASTETGQQAIGEKKTRLEGKDNTLLLQADLDELDMDFSIEKVSEDDKFYYITYTYLDLVKRKQAWQYELREKTRKVSKQGLGERDLGKYVAEELSEQYHARIKELKRAKRQARETGEQKRVEVTEYSGLIGRTLAVAGQAFDGYEPVKKREVPSPADPLEATTKIRNTGNTQVAGVSTTTEESTSSSADDLTDLYADYIKENDPDRDDFFGTTDNCPETYNPDQVDSDNDGIGDACEDQESGDSGTTEAAEQDGTMTSEDSNDQIDSNTSTTSEATSTNETATSSEETTGEPETTSSSTDDTISNDDSTDSEESTSTEDVLSNPDGDVEVVECDSENLDICSSQDDCEAAGGYWYDGNCNQEEEVIESSTATSTDK